MQATFAPTKAYPTDFLAEVASRTRAAAPNRSRIAMRLSIFAAVGDALVIAGALLAAFWLRFGFGTSGQSATESVALSDYAGYMIGTGALASVILICLGLYNRDLLLHFRQTISRLGKGWGIWTCALLSLGTLFDFQPSISRLYLFTASAFVGLGLIAWRSVLVRVYRRKSLAAPLRQRVLLIGWNPEAERLAQVISERPELPFNLIGCLASPSELAARPSTQIARLGGLDELTDVVKYSLIDVVILTEHQASREDIIRIANICEREIVQFQLVPSYFEILLAGLHLQNINGVPLLGVSKLPLNAISARLAKRIFDIIGGTVGLILTAPIIAIFGALVLIESPGKLFYRQRRSGRHGRNFEIIKIRSMRADAESDGKIGWSTKEDPRRLRVGSLMRRLNIDELPQFWNVLKGEMSLVGPRPERPELISGFKHEIPHYNARHTVKPGITGWAQIHGYRGDTDLTERIRHDIYYMENWSLWLDLQCLLFTFCARTNAY